MYLCLPVILAEAIHGKLLINGDTLFAVKNAFAPRKSEINTR